MVQIHPVRDPADPAIRKFGDLQERTYGDPEMLIPPAVLPEILATQTPERRNLTPTGRYGQWGLLINRTRLIAHGSKWNRKPLLTK